MKLLGLDLPQQLSLMQDVLLLLLHLRINEVSDMLLQDVNLVLLGVCSIVDRAFAFFELHAKRRGVPIGTVRIALFVEWIIYFWPLHDTL